MTIHKFSIKNFTILSLFLAPFFLCGTPVAMEKNTLRVALGDSPSKIDLSENNTIVSINILQQLYLPLLSQYDDWHLLKSWVVSSDGLHYTLTLKENLLWSDSTPVEAGDLIKSIKHTLSRKNHLLTGFAFGGVAKKNGEYQLQKIDAYTIKLELERPDPFFIERIGAIHVSLHNLSYSPTDKGSKQPKTLSPFRIEKENLPESLSLIKVDNFPGADKLFWDKVEIRFMPRIEHRIAALKAGEVDVIRIFDLSDRMITDRMPGKLLLSRLPNTRRLFIHPGKEAFANPKFREALNLLAHPDTLIHSKKSTLETELYSLVPENIDAEYTPYKDPAANIPRQERFDRARELLTDIGITPETPLELDFKVIDKRSVSFPMEKFQNITKRYGLNLKITKQESETHYGDYFKGDFDLLTEEWFSPLPLIHYHLVPFSPSAPAFQQGYDNPDYLEWFNKAQTAKSKREAYDAIYQAEKLLRDSNYFIPYAAFFHAYMIGPNLDQGQSTKEQLWQLEPAVE